MIEIEKERERENPLNHFSKCLHKAEIDQQKPGTYIQKLHPELPKG